MFTNPNGMRFDDLFSFILKRFNEIDFDNEDAEELKRIFTRIRIKYNISHLNSGVVLDKEYKSYGFNEKKETK